MRTWTTNSSHTPCQRSLFEEILQEQRKKQVEEYESKWQVVQERAEGNRTHKTPRTLNQRTLLDRRTDAWKILLWAAEFKWPLSPQMQYIAWFYNVAKATYELSIFKSSYKKQSDVNYRTRTGCWSYKME